MEQNKNKLEQKITDILFVFPVMMYFLVEAIIVGLFIAAIWRFILSNIFGEINYIQWVAIYWIVKMLLFDVFKLIGGFTVMSRNLENNTESLDYNEGTTE